MNDDVTASWEALRQVNDELNDANDSMLPMLSIKDPTVVRLSDGDWHVCERDYCPYACVDPDNHAYFCSLSGLCWGTEYVAGPGPSWTGRSTTTSDPDAISGTPVGGWRSRRDAYIESQRAFQSASRISDKEVIYVETQRERKARETRMLSRKNARCVDEELENVQKTTKLKSSQRPQTRELHDKLSTEVLAIIDRLISVKKDDCSCSIQDRVPAKDIRLQNPDFVIKVAIHQMIKRATTRDDVINYSRVNDIVLYAQTFAKRKREEADAHTTVVNRNKRYKVFGGDVKTRITHLVISLWKAVCATEYLSNVVKRGCDSFRPFVSGILYATKRGVCMSNGLEIVPAIHHISKQLPTLRCQDATDSAKQLQSSSHRGLCCLHRSIASFETSDPNSANYAKVKQAFIDAASVAAQLSSYCSYMESAVR
jgi:hypothetical protein